MADYCCTALIKSTVPGTGTPSVRIEHRLIDIRKSNLKALRFLKKAKVAYIKTCGRYVREKRYSEYPGVRVSESLVTSLMSFASVLYLATVG